MQQREQKQEEHAEILKTREWELLRNEEMFKKELENKLKVLRWELTDEINLEKEKMRRWKQKHEELEEDCKQWKHRYQVIEEEFLQYRKKSLTEGTPVEQMKAEIKIKT